MSSSLREEREENAKPLREGVQQQLSAMKAGPRMSFTTTLDAEISPSQTGRGRMETGTHDGLPTRERSTKGDTRRPSWTEGSGGATKLRRSVSGILAMATLSTVLLLFAHHRGMPVTPPLGGRADLRHPRIFWSSWQPKDPSNSRSLRGGKGVRGAVAHGSSGVSEDGVATRQEAARVPIRQQQQRLRSRDAWRDGSDDKSIPRASFL